MLSQVDLCPCQLGANRCGHLFGHLGLHQVQSEVGPRFRVEMLWADDWYGLANEAHTQIEGNGLPIVEA